MTRFRARGRLVALLLTVVALVACGKKGPPRPPVRIVPARIATVEVTRVADRVYLEFEVPTTNSDRSTPGDIDRVEVYAVTVQPEAGAVRPAFSEDWLEAATLIATLPVRPPGVAAPRPAGPGAGAGDPDRTTSDGEAPLDADSAPDDGMVAQGEAVTVVERLTPDTWQPVTIGDPDDEADDDDDAGAARVVPRPFVGPPVPPVPIRQYVAFGVSSRNRDGDPSTTVAVPLVPPPAPPGPLAVDYTERSVQLSWDPPPTLRVPVQLEVVVPPTLESTPIVEGFESSEYVVSDLGADGDPDVARPTPLGAPRTTTTYTDADMTFGETRCYAVRVLEHIDDDLELLGPASPATCVVLADTFPPAAPTGVIAVSDAGSISLVWNENAEPDVAGYAILRGRASDATLQPLTTEPVVDPTFRDTDVVAGERYIYQVLALDTAVPPNVSTPSVRITETAR